VKYLLPICLLVSAAPAPPPVDFALITSEALPPKLSDFHFFVGTAPNARVLPYTLTTPLFSDYTDKARFVFVPSGQTAAYTEDSVLNLPVGSALIKTFSYGDHKIETRVLLHRTNGWVALPYVWNAEGTDAVLKRAGARIDVTYQGQPVSYAVPNVNQCKECHQSGANFTPIGPKARNLDAAQLTNWVKTGLLDRAPADSKLARWDDAAAPLNMRARAYLDVNCGHCHNPNGAASNSGLNLTYQTTDPTALGINKTPVAAGRGSGGRYVAIAPGDPDHSIMLYRMASVEPGVAMPEVGRSMVHAEGVKLLSDWIAQMPKSLPNS
jgi:uncharacterized repeat protein (TIGR03806 family)